MDMTCYRFYGFPLEPEDLCILFLLKFVIRLSNHMLIYTPCQLSVATSFNSVHKAADWYSVFIKLKFFWNDLYKFFPSVASKTYFAFLEQQEEIFLSHNHSKFR